MAAVLGLLSAASDTTLRANFFAMAACFCRNHADGEQELEAERVRTEAGCEANDARWFPKRPERKCFRTLLFQQCPEGAVSGHC